MRWIFLLILLQGCASATFHRNDLGEVEKISTKGNIAASYEREGEKITTDSKWSDLLKGIFQLNKVQTI